MCQLLSWRLIIWWFPQVEDYTLQINELHELFRKRSDDFDKIQDGMKQMKEFEKTKSQMEQELSDVGEGGNITLSSVLVHALTTDVYVW